MLTSYSFSRTIEDVSLLPLSLLLFLILSLVEYDGSGFGMLGLAWSFCFVFEFGLVLSPLFSRPPHCPYTSVVLVLS
jgi:hypothetical protein